jgi:hypothetical protein
MADVLKIPFFETSAKEASNVESVFRAITGKILEEEWMLPNTDNAWQQNSICLHDYPENLEFGQNSRKCSKDPGNIQKCWGKCQI